MAGEKFRAGAAMVDITPSRELVNYNGDRLSIDADASPLRCQAVVFEDGETKGAILSVDTTFIDRTFLLRIRDACERATGVPGTNILVAATHTHAAPASCVSFLTGALPDPQYLDQMVEGVVEAVVTARGDLRSSFVKAVNCAAPGCEKNRRLLRPNGLVVISGASNAQPDFPPAGPTDPVLSVLAFTDPGGYPIAIVTNYAVHNNTVGGTCNADLGGRIGDALREQFGPQLVTPFLEAPCADVTWSGPEDGPQKGDELARLIGSSVAESVTVALSETSPVGVEAVRFLTTVEDYPDRLHEDSTFCRDDSRGDT
jgi:neutral ceramidase